MSGRTPYAATHHTHATGRGRYFVQVATLLEPGGLTMVDDIRDCFIWWHVVDGVALALPDTREVRAAIDAGELKNIYGSIEGAIKHGGVIATAFKRTTERTYDAAHWLQTGERVPVGYVTTTEITASPAGCEGCITEEHTS